MKKLEMSYGVKKNGMEEKMKIIIFSGFSKYPVHFHKELLLEMVIRGHEVYAIGPETGYEGELKKLGVSFLRLSFRRHTANPFHGLLLLLRLLRIMNEVKPDLYFGYTFKPAVYGSVAAFLCGVKKRYIMATGLDSLFIKKKHGKMPLKHTARLLCKIGFYCSTRVFFQNRDDRSDMLKLKLLNRRKGLVIKGPGVNLDYYRPCPIPKRQIFLFAGSLSRDKGVCEYIQAAAMLKVHNPEVQCWIVGAMDHGVSSITEEELMHSAEEGSIRYFGTAEDIRPYLNDCRFYVFPSYREGIPQSVLEAMAVGRPIITTDAPGCRETVINGRNGFLVPAGDAMALFDRMQWLLKHPGEAEEMAWESLLLVQKKYDMYKVNRRVLKKMHLIV